MCDAVKTMSVYNDITVISANGNRRHPHDAQCSCVFMMWNAQVGPMSIATTGFVLSPAAMETTTTTTTMDEQQEMLNKEKVNANVERDLFLSLMTTELLILVNQF